MTIALKQLTDLSVEFWDPGKSDLTKAPVAFVRGNGTHWQALVQEPEGWFIRDKKSFQVRNLNNFLAVSCRHGMVLALRRELSKPSGDVDWGNSTPNRKRPHHEVENSQPQLHPNDSSSSSGASILIPDGDEDEQARAYARTGSDDDSTQQMLINLGQSPTPQLQAAPTPQNGANTPASPRAKQNQWVAVTVGVTPMLYNGTTKMYKCAHCDLQKPTALGIATHTGKYCQRKKSQPTTKAGEGDTKKEEDDEDIL